MTRECFFAPKGTKYLSEIPNFTEIPQNCIFNKGRTGCGGTEMAIRHATNSTIIVVPTKDLVNNKTLGREDNIKILGVTGDTTNSQIKSYMRLNAVWKIVVTYDSLPRVIKMAQSCDLPIYDKFLLIDEYHLLFRQLDFRYSAIRNLLDSITKFDKVTFMSATPLTDWAIFEQLKKYDRVTVEWEEKLPINVTTIITKSPIHALIASCKAILKSEDNGHYFINSVEAIGSIISTLGLTPQDARVVCSSSGDSSDKNTKKLNDFPISSTKAPVKRLNFYTSTAFEGSDIFDKRGKMCVAVMGGKEHTLIDVPTTLHQICGRLRDTQYKEDVMLIFSSSYKSTDVSIAEYAQATRDIYSTTQTTCNWINSLSEQERAMFESTHNNTTYINEKYIRKESGKWLVDTDLLKLDIAKYRLKNRVYTNIRNIEEELSKNGFKVLKSYRYEIDESVEIARNPKTKIAFKTLFNRYCEHLKYGEVFNMGLILAQDIATEHPIVKQAYEILGEDVVKSMNYHAGNIKRKIYAMNTTDTTITKVINLCKQMLKTQTPIPLSKIKSDLQSIYDTLGIDHRAKASDILQWCEVKNSSIYDNGKKILCYTIIRYGIFRIKGV